MVFNWDIIYSNIRDRLSHKNFTTWFNSVSFIKFEEDSNTVVLSVPDKFTYNWIVDNYQNLINEEIFNFTNKEIKLTFEIASTNVNRLKNDIKPINTNNDIFSINNCFLSQVINPKYDFENFIVGNCNEFARAASLAVSEKPGKIYNPLFIYGGTGLGKTHLLCAIGLAVLKKDPSIKICYLNSERFMNELIASIRTDKTDCFRKKFREQSDVLLIDDIQFMSGKERTQEEFFFTYNELYQNKKQMVIVSDTNPRDLKDFEDRLISRFEWGLIADIQPPDMETRIAIIRNKIATINLPVSDEIVLFLAQNIRSNIREIEGYLNRIHGYSSLSNLEVTIPLLKRILPDLFQSHSLNLTPNDIIKCVSSFYNLKITDLLSDRRLKAFTVPRHIAMYLSRKLTRSSFPEIGKNFGGKDHTTIIHAYEKISKQLNTNPELQSIINSIENNLVF